MEEIFPKSIILKILCAVEEPEDLIDLLVISKEWREIIIKTPQIMLKLPLILKR